MSDDIVELLLIIKAWTAIDRLSIIRKFDRSNKIKRNLFQDVAMLLNGFNHVDANKRIEKKIDENNTRILRAVLNKL